MKSVKLPKISRPKLKSSKKKKRKKSKAKKKKSIQTKKKKLIQAKKKKKKTQVKQKKYKLPSVPRISRVDGRLERTKNYTAFIYFLIGIVFLIVMILQAFKMI